MKPVCKCSRLNRKGNTLFAIAFPSEVLAVVNSHLISVSAQCSERIIDITPIKSKLTTEGVSSAGTSAKNFLNVSVASNQAIMKN